MIFTHAQYVYMSINEACSRAHTFISNTFVKIVLLNFMFKLVKTTDLDAL